MLAYSCSAILLVAAAFHFYWGWGGRYGNHVSIPQHPNGERVFTPRPGAAHFVGVALIGGVLCILAAAKHLTLPVPESLPRAATAWLALIFLVRALGWFRYVGFFKQVRSTPFARYDTWFYCPLRLFLGISLGMILLNDSLNG